MRQELKFQKRSQRISTWKGLALAVALLLCGTTTYSQTRPAAVRYDAQTRVFRIDAAHISYVFGVNNQGELQSLYWGQQIGAADSFSAAHANPPWASFEPPTDTTPQEYVGWGGGFYYVPDLKITFPDGNRDLVLKYVSHTIQGDTLNVVMKDISLAVYVTLQYKVDPGTGILRRSATVENKTGKPFTIEQDFAASWNLPANSHYELRYLTGRWAGEWNVQKEHLHPGKVVLGSRSGTTSHHVNPWFAIERGNPDDQDTGNVWFGALGWSGDWQIAIEQNQAQQVRITGGFNPFDFAYLLEPGQSLRSPYFYAGFSHHGIGGASRLMHRFELAKILPQHPHPRVRPVLYDSWEATRFNINVAGQEKLAEEAASIGVERFVMDDGWFGERDNDHAGLGDWWPNPKKFPNGLKPLIDKVHSLGMSFGIWVEPEMVNPDSELYRKHPDWVLNFPGRPRSEARNQLVLNLARPDVKAYVFQVLDSLLSHNDISFIKWDYNRNWAEPGWPAVANDKEKEVYVKYIRNLYSILRELRARHPNVEFEACSGGGGRVDLGIMRYTDEVWTSDNTDPFDRLSIQQGFTYAYTPGVMMAWVTGSPNSFNGRVTSLQYRFLSSMEGSLGIGDNLNKWMPDDFTTACKMVAQYKTIRATVQHGALYRLISPLNGSEYAVNEYVDQDGAQTVAFAYLHSSQKGFPFPRIYLRGLNPSANYNFRMLDGKAAPGTPASASGAYWMHAGVQLMLRGDFKAALLELNRTE